MESSSASHEEIERACLAIRQVRSRLLNYSWRRLKVGTVLVLISIDAIFTFLTVYNVVRNQYFFLGEAINGMIWNIEAIYHR